MNKRTCVRNIVLFLLGGFAITAALYYNVIAVHQGETDYSSMLDGKPPVYAKKYAAASDGGTIWYKGNGYSLYGVHSLHQEKGVDGYLVGPRIRYFPFVLAGKNKESLHFEADMERRP